MITLALAGFIIIAAVCAVSSAGVAIYATRMATRITSEAMRTSMEKPAAPTFFPPFAAEKEPESQPLDEIFPDSEVFTQEEDYISQRLRRESDEVLERDSEATA